MVYEKSMQTDFEYEEKTVAHILGDESKSIQGINVDDLMISDDSDFSIPAEYLTSIEVIKEEKLDTGDLERKYKEVVSTREFQDFFFKASKVVEKCIRQPFDPL